jgi:hypothetical protein
MSGATKITKKEIEAQEKINARHNDLIYILTKGIGYLDEKSEKLEVTPLDLQIVLGNMYLRNNPGDVNAQNQLLVLARAQAQEESKLRKICKRLGLPPKFLSEYASLENPDEVLRKAIREQIQPYFIN